MKIVFFDLFIFGTIFPGICSEYTLPLTGNSLLRSNPPLYEPPSPIFVLDFEESEDPLSAPNPRAILDIN